MQGPIVERLAWIIASLIFITACGTISDPYRDDQSSCTPSFPYQQGWLGGDAAYSIPISDDETLWFFGDTFVGEEGAADRRDAAFIANSVAKSTCTDARWQIEFFWRAENDLVQPIFQPHSSAYKYWPLSSFWHQDALYIFLERVEYVKDGGAFPFRIIGVDLARIENPSAPPNGWRSVVRPLYEGKDLIPGIANFVDGENLLIYTALEGEQFKKTGEHHAVILARLSL